MVVLEYIGYAVIGAVAIIGLMSTAGGIVWLAEDHPKIFGVLISSILLFACTLIGMAVVEKF